MIDCEEDDLTNRLERAAPPEELDGWLRNQMERAFSVQLERNGLTATFLDSIHRYDDEPSGPVV